MIDKKSDADSPALGRLAEEVLFLCRLCFLKLTSFRSSSSKILSATVLKSLSLCLTLVALGVLIVVG